MASQHQHLFGHGDYVPETDFDKEVLAETILDMQAVDLLNEHGFSLLHQSQPDRYGHLVLAGRGVIDREGHAVSFETVAHLHPDLVAAIKQLES